MTQQTSKRPHESCNHKHACKRRRTTFIMSALPDRLTPKGSSSVSPQDLLHSLLTSHGIKPANVSYKSLDGFFADPTEAEISSYRSDVLDAVRSRDIVALRSFYEQGRPLKCSNQFGESLLHLACRRGFLDVVRFLVEDAHVPLRVRDDYGRTPLHDALWTTDPHPELVDYIITNCPDLLYIKDRRENTPFSFVRKNDYGVWVELLLNLPITKLEPKFLLATKQ